MNQFENSGMKLDLRGAIIIPLLFSTIVGCSADQVVGRDENSSSAGASGVTQGGASTIGTAGASGVTQGGASTSGTAGTGGVTQGGASTSGTAGTSGITQAGASTSGTAGTGGATQGGASTIGTAGASGHPEGGSVGSTLPNLGGAAGFCNGLDGAWTARFTLDTASRTGSNCWVSENGLEPAFKNDAPGALGIALTSQNGKCQAKLYPEFGGVIETEMSSTESGLEFSASSITSLHWCHPMDWQLWKLNLVRSSPPTARMQVRAVGFCDDTSFVSDTTWNGTLTQGLFSQALRLKSENSWGLVCGWTTSMDSPLRVLPWHRVITKTALPADQVFASGIDPELPAPWPLPLSYAVAQSQTVDMEWALSADRAAFAYVQIAHTNLAPVFAGDTLAQLATKGTAAIELVAEVPALRLTGKRCTEPIWAGGRLQVAGKQRVVFEIEGLGGLMGSSSDAPGTISARVIDPTGADTPAPVWTKVDGSNRRVGTIALAGQSEVGVELAFDVDCAPISVMFGNPDMRIHAIRAE